MHFKLISQMGLRFGRRLNEDEIKQLFRVVVRVQLAPSASHDHAKFAIGDWIIQAEKWFSKSDVYTWVNTQYEESYVLLLDALKARCDKARIKWEDITSVVDGPAMRLILPTEEDNRSVYVLTYSQALSLLGVSFEDYTILADYDAICNLKGGYIEAAISSLQQLSYESIYRLFNGCEYKKPQEESASLGSLYQVPLRTSIKSELDLSDKLPLDIRQAETSISFSGRTQEFLALIGYGTLSPSSGLPTLQIHVPKLQDYNTAVQLLDTLSDAIFFEVDMVKRLSFGLVRKRTFNTQRQIGQPAAPVQDINFPRSKYDREPISLYWYAKSSRTLPLVQYLAFYQCLEYYFPRYSQEVAKNRVAQVLKNPSFNVHNDADLMKLLVAVKAGSGKAYGDEKAQLQATLDECLDSEELRERIRSSNREEFFRTSKLLSSHTLNLGNPNLNIKQEVANRIYDIRCKIVHTKVGEGENAMLLPYSKEVKQLSDDISLIEYVAQQVLINSSQHLNVGD